MLRVYDNQSATRCVAAQPPGQSLGRAKSTSNNHQPTANTDLDSKSSCIMVHDHDVSRHAGCELRLRLRLSSRLPKLIADRGRQLRKDRCNSHDNHQAWLEGGLRKDMLMVYAERVRIWNVLIVTQQSITSRNRLDALMRARALVTFCRTTSETHCFSYRDGLNQQQRRFC